MPEESQRTKRGAVTSPAGMLRNAPECRTQFKAGGGEESKSHKRCTLGDMDILGSFSPDDEAQEKTRGQRLTSWKKSSMGIVRKV